ncbi:flagellar basal body P-ring protein FlgI [Anaplasmataceae bacterium AB001_6]|nr:flagellar basal body P-ring protein FlgI [Anaplasmataceae bacterium AB001_6]
MKYIFCFFSFVFFISGVNAQVKGFNIPYEMQQDVSDDILLDSDEYFIKDIVNYEGVRDNVLVGFGLVVGLNSTGDNLRNSFFTQQSLESFLGKMGINARGANLRTRNVAAVTVTAVLPAFATQGSPIDAQVSTIGDANSLEGGVLLATPLLGIDGRVYSVAQGQLSLRNVNSVPGSRNKNIGTKTVAFIPNGAIVENEVGFSYDDMEDVRLSLRNPEFDTAVNVENIINESFDYDIAHAQDKATIVVNLPDEYKGNIVAFLNKIGNLKVEVGGNAKIVIDSQTGTFVIGNRVRLTEVAISHANTNVTIGKDIKIFNANESLYSLIEGLNKLALPINDIISILNTLSLSGALQGEIIVK